MAFQERLDKIDAEISELTRLIGLTTLDSVKSYLQSKLDSETERRKYYVKNTLNPANNQNLGTVLVKDYAWDQTESKVMIYVSNDRTEKIDPSTVSLVFNSPDNFTCVFGKFRFTLGNLFAPVYEERTTAKLTTSNRMVIILMKQKFSHWTDVQKKVAKTAPSFNKGDDADPQRSIMNLMQQMYEDGDDEMKQTIRKSMYEANQKRGQDLDGFSGLGDTLSSNDD